MATAEELKRDARHAIEEVEPELVGISDWMYANPELGLQEVKAAERLTRLLESQGAKVERGIAGLPTAFRAQMTPSTDRPKIAILAEYDALPEVGHGCGHNIIATAAIGAGLALRKVADRLPGSVVVLGCPAEESAVPNAGGKIYLIESGFFDDIDAAIMIHPMNENRIGTGSSLVARGIEFEFFGKPWENPAMYDTLSPIRYVKNVRTPTLMVQSEEDFRTPMGNAELWYMALKKMDVPVELVRYPRSTHELSRSGEPWLLVDRLGRIRQWFAYWLQDKPDGRVVSR